MKKYVKQHKKKKALQMKHLIASIPEQHEENIIILQNIRGQSFNIQVAQKQTTIKNSKF